jgi:Zn-dependent protease with chaperone function
MTLLLSSVLLGLVWFAAINAVTSMAVWVAAHALVRRTASADGADRFGSRLLLTVRLLPAAASTFFVGVCFLPAHLRFEPADADESLGVVLAALVAIAVFILLRTGWRALRAGVAGHCLATLVRRAGTSVQELVEDNAAGSAFELDGLAGVSLAGIWRPRILVGSEALATLTPAELDVAISHEVAHRRAKDNLKRFLMFCAPDLLGWTAVARQLEARWEAEAEYEADARAVMGRGDRAVVLASALVKVARLSGLPDRSLAHRWSISSAFHVPTLLEMRVRRLVSGSVDAPSAPGTLAWSAAVVCLAISAGMWMLGPSHLLHLVTEAMVTHLP